MKARRVPRSAWVLLLGLALGLAAASPAEAGVRVFVGGVFGYPGPYAYYPYPYVYPYPYAYPYAVPVPYPYVAYPEVPPPGWVPGRWEWQRDAWGRPIQVWVPPHLR
jgi:hypothetical protein